jgi:hypothetical protein
MPLFYPYPGLGFILGDTFGDRSQQRRTSLMKNQGTKKVESIQEISGSMCHVDPKFGFHDVKYLLGPYMKT